MVGPSAILLDMAQDQPEAASWPWKPAVTEETRREIEYATTRYPALLDEMKRDVGALLEKGSMPAARDLASATGEHFNHNEPPLFFTGDLDASFVLVHLNPKQRDITSDEPPASLPFRSFEEYFDVCRHFGARMYGPAASRAHRAQFDHKQIQFLEPFGVIDFVDEHGEEDRFTNLERVLDGKLQLELIPYGSDSFSARGLSRDLLKPHHDRLMSVITAKPRDYVIFCGAVFERLMGPNVLREHRFRLEKADGSKTRDEYRFANLRLPYKETEIKAGLALSWARQGIPMSRYAEAVRDRYEAD